MNNLVSGLIFYPDSNGNSALSRYIKSYIKSKMLSNGTQNHDRIYSYITEPKEKSRIELARRERRNRLRSAAKLQLVSVLAGLHWDWRDEYPNLEFKWNPDQTCMTLYTFHKKFIRLSRDEVDKISEDDPFFFENMRDLNKNKSY
tara:strand:+ start:456 stop:890 length:435 start_codon:yes stop_codon:yes gene_type:complete